jgi:Transposase DDE domain
VFALAPALVVGWVLNTLSLSEEEPMENTPYLYETLLGVLGQHSQWLDLRHRQTLAWMMMGLLCSKTVSLGAWTPFVVSRAQYAQSVVRRFRRWLDKNRLKVEPLYGPLSEQAFVGGMGKRVYVALDTSMLWNTYCLIRWSVIYRGRAVPLGWRVSEHGSALVSFETYKALLDEAKTRLPLACVVVFLADRGFADTQLRSHLKGLGWHWRMRIKSNFWIHPSHLASFQVGEIALQPGHMSFWQGVSMTDKRFGPVHLAMARPLGSDEYWYVISDEAAELKTLEEYGLRFDIEENFWDDKSNGFQWESSLMRSAEALERLCFVLAMTTLSLVSVGTSVVKQGKRRLVDPHWFRGSRYLKIGWNWVNYALNRGCELITTVYLSSEPDPEPAMASKKQDEKRRQSRFVFEYQEAA